MRKIIILLLLLVSTVLFSKDWTILVYMASDNGLYEYALEDIEEMENSNFGSKVNLIVQIDGAEWADDSDAYRYKIGYHPEEGIQSRKIASLGEINSGSYQTLRSFVDWGFDKYSSDHKALVVWSHGDGWAKGDISEKWVGSDSESNSAISMSRHEMQKALKNTQVDILIYDACTLQSVENLEELVGYSDYIIGSEETVSAKGFPYTEMLDYWVTEDNMDSLAVNISKIYVEAYRPGNSHNPGYSLRKTTCSTVKMSEWPSFSNDLTAFFVKWSGSTELFRDTRDNIYEFNHLDLDVDIMELLTELRSRNPNSELAEDCTTLLESLHRTFIGYDSSAFGYRVGTATIWFPDRRSSFVNMWDVYNDLYFSNKGYSYFLNRYLTPDDTPPLDFELERVNTINETLYLSWQDIPDPDTLNYTVYLEFADGTSQYVEDIYSNTAEIDVLQSGFVMVSATDRSGNVTKSESHEFTFKEGNSKVYFAPNPLKVSDGGRLIIYSPEHQATTGLVEIYDIAGKLIASKRVELNGDGAESKFPIEELLPRKISSGIYWCRVKIASKIYTTKFSVEN